MLDRSISGGVSPIVRTVENNSGSMSLTEYPVFPGISLVYKNAHMLRCDAVVPPDHELIQIEHCCEGRYEQHFGDQYYYLSAGDLSISRSSVSGSEVYFPTSNYHGISVLIDPDSAPDSLSCILDDVNVRPADLFNKFCSSGSCFIIRSNDRLEHIFSELYTVPESIRGGYMKLKVLELLLFLNTVSSSDDPVPDKRCSKSQVKLAKAVCSYVCMNIGTHFTIDQLAEHFGVSPTHLKNSFRSVYGSSVYAFVRTQKMLAAAHMLQNTDRTILDIAGECGYDNGSKFSKAFSSVMGVTPSEFRKNKDISIESLRLERRNMF